MGFQEIICPLKRFQCRSLFGQSRGIFTINAIDMTGFFRNILFSHHSDQNVYPTTVAEKILLLDADKNATGVLVGE